MVNCEGIKSASTKDLVVQQFCTRGPLAYQRACEIPLSKVNDIPWCTCLYPSAPIFVHREMQSCRAHTCRHVFLSGVRSCQALLIHARLKDSPRHCAHASTHSTFTAHGCTPDLLFLLFGCRREWMLHSCLPLSVSKARGCHPTVFVWSFAGTQLSEGKEPQMTLTQRRTRR